MQSVVVMMLSLGLALGCGKKDEAKGDEPAAAKDKPADDKPADDKPADDKPADDKPADDKPAPAGEEPVICCEFGGATGTSTKTKCEESGGKVVDGLEPPCTK